MSDQTEDKFSMQSEQVAANAWLDKVEFRLLKREDLPALEWDGEYIHFRRLFQEVFQNASQGRAIMWGVDLDGKGLIGQAFVQLFSARNGIAEGKHRAYMHAFRVKPPYRGVGLGSRLLKVVERDLAQRGFRQVTLNVARDNPGARRFYERNGFRVVGVEPGQWSYIDHKGRKQKVNEPSWRMQKRISGMLTES